jgi:N-acetylglucosaminylphosphatidylinositol deacetylase family protein
MTRRKILVVAAHPDDEVLGVGGTVLRHVAEGDTVHVMILAEGLTSRDVTRNVAECREALSELHETAQRVAESMGVSKLFMEKFPDNRMDGVHLLDVVKRIEAVVDTFTPDIVYTHHGGDVNVDHQIAHDAVLTATRPVPGSAAPNLYFFETLSSTEWQIQTSNRAFLPTFFVDIEPYIEKKLEVLRLYEREMRNYPHSRSYEAVEVLAKLRGVTAGVRTAEAFAVGRMYWK